MITVIIRALLWLAASAAACLSVYGWLFHFNVGPTHGAGMELGIIAGVCAAGLSIVALRCKARDGHRAE
jgi:hypothetical protein